MNTRPTYQINSVGDFISWIPVELPSVGGNPWLERNSRRLQPDEERSFFSRVPYSNLVLPEDTGFHEYSFTLYPERMDKDYIPSLFVKISVRKITNKEIYDFEPECSICMEKFIKKDIVGDLACKHLFHEDCINEWGKINETCPLCRTVLVN